ncbi:MAG: hypothetical protein RL026_771 [Pseudomonadota bacterium]|jgi:DNA processing protein
MNGMASDDLAVWLTLARAPYVHAGHLHAAVALAGTAAALWRRPVPELRALGLPPAACELLSAADPQWRKDLAWLEQEAVHLLPCTAASYPPRLAATARGPALLFVRGDPQCLLRPQIAIVGTRQPTPAGRELARDLALELAAAGMVVTSGLARGIDAAAHDGALLASGPTIAVCGTGLDQVYPPEHAGLAARIAASGACISEFARGTQPSPRHFPRRNRIISGLSLAVVVVEAATGSGSLITARHALEQGREVLAMPGSPRNPQAGGCHELIRSGACLVRDAKDIIDEIAPLLPQDRRSSPQIIERSGSRPRSAKLDSAAEILLDAAGFDPVSRDTLVARTGFPPGRVAAILLDLETQQQLEAMPGGLYARPR